MLQSVAYPVSSDFQMPVYQVWALKLGAQIKELIKKISAI